MTAQPMTTPAHTFELESYERRDAAGRYNRGRVARIDYRSHVVRADLNAGDTDATTLRRFGHLLIVVSVNPRHGYAGAELFDLNDTDGDGYAPKLGDVFARSADDVRALDLGDVFELGDGTNARRFFNLVCELSA